ncbi:hypothetical protein Tco_1026112 [Tanacetum coccineum]
MCDGENPAKENGVLSSNDSDDDIIGNRWTERRPFDDYDISKDIGLGSFVPSDSDDDIIGNRWIERRSFDDYDISQDIGLGSFVPSDSDDDIIGNRWIERRSFDDYDISQDIGLGPRSSDADEHIEDMGFTVGSYMHIHEDTGCVIGGIKFVDRHLNETDCTQFKVANIPLDVDGIKVTNFSAKFILLVEKIDLAMRLRTSRFYSQFPCVIVATMGRAPDYSTKKFLYLLNNGGGLKLQLFALLDSPNGIASPAIGLSLLQLLGTENAEVEAPRVDNRSIDELMSFINGDNEGHKQTKSSKSKNKNFKGKGKQKPSN